MATRDEDAEPRTTMDLDAVLVATDCRPELLVPPLPPLRDATASFAATAVVRARARSFDALVRPFPTTAPSSASFSASALRPRSQSVYASALPTTATETLETGFLDVFGRLGLVTVLAFLLSAVAAFGTAYIQVFPTATANWLMATTSYNGGEFWLLPDPDLTVEVPAVVLLVSFGLGYLALCALMLFLRPWILRRMTKRKLDRLLAQPPQGAVLASKLQAAVARVASRPGTSAASSQVVAAAAGRHRRPRTATARTSRVATVTRIVFDLDQSKRQVLVSALAFPACSPISPAS